MAYDNTDKGSLFKNDKKETDKHPDYTGQINIGGAEFWLSAWLKTAESGRKYMSLAVKPKEAQRPAQKPTQKPAPSRPSKASTGFDDMDSDIPF